MGKSRNPSIVWRAVPFPRLPRCFLSCYVQLFPSWSGKIRAMACLGLTSIPTEGRCHSRNKNVGPFSNKEYLDINLYKVNWSFCENGINKSDIINLFFYYSFYYPIRTVSPPSILHTHPRVLEPVNVLLPPVFISRRVIFSSLAGSGSPDVGRR